MKDFIMITMDSTSGQPIAFSFRKSKLVSLGMNGENVTLIVEGASQPFVFTSDSLQQSKKMYDGIALEMSK